MFGDTIGNQLNWDYILPSQVGKDTLVGISNILPNSVANATKRFNQQQFSPMNYLPHTTNNSLQAQYGIQEFDEGGSFGDIDMDKEISGDIEGDIMGTNIVAPTPMPVKESKPIELFVNDMQSQESDEVIASMILGERHRSNYIMQQNAQQGVNLSGIQGDVMSAGQELLSKFPGLKITSGMRNWGDKDAHPIGRALDISGDAATLKQASDYYASDIVPKYRFNKPLPLVHSSVKDGKVYTGGAHIHVGYY